jgi:ribosome biogenesis protein ENP2
MTNAYSKNDSRRRKYDKAVNKILNFDELYFPSYSKKLKESYDKKFLFATGTYPPQIKCFDLKNMGIKFTRYLNNEVRDFKLLNSNWEKFVILREDRTLEFHTKQGFFYNLKIPENGFDLSYSRLYGKIFIPSLNGNVFSVDLTEGKFSVSIKNNLKIEKTCSAINESETIIGLGDSNGTVNFYDLRTTKNPFKSFEKMTNSDKNSSSVTTIRFLKERSTKVAIGHNSGEIFLYDLRSKNPILSKDMGYNLPIKTIKNFINNDFIISSNSREVSFWNIKNGKGKISIKSKYGINDFCKLKNKDFLFLAVENPRIMVKSLKKTNSLAINRKTF